MQTNLVQFKSVIQDFESFFHFNAACTTVVAKLAVLECLKWLEQVEDAAKAQQPPCQETPVEQPPITDEVKEEPQPVE